MVSNKRGPALLLSLLVLCVPAVAVGCGGDDDSGGGEAASTGGGGSDSALVAEAKQATEELLQRPTEIPVTEPIGRPVPGGKTVALMQCGFPGCIPLGEHIREAAESLGWTVETINTGLTPEEVKTGWQQAVRDQPDAVATIVYPSTIFRAELDQLQEQDIPVVACCSPEPAGNGIDLMVNALENGKVIGTAMANYVVGSRDGEVHPLLVDIGGLPIAQTVTEAFKEEFSRLAPDQTVDDLVVPSTSVGKDAPSRIVGYLRSNPDVDLIVLSETSPVQGLPAALKAAGIDTPIFGEGSDPTVYEYIRTGQMEGTVAFDPWGVGYLMVDGLARTMSGGNIDDSNVMLPRWVLTPENIPDGDSFPVVPGTSEQFEELWGVN